LDITTFSSSLEGSAASALPEDDGSSIILLTSDGGQVTVYRFNLSTPYDLNSTVSYSPVADRGLISNVLVNDANDFDMSRDGTEIYVGNRSNDRVYQWSLNTPWDISEISGSDKVKEDLVEGSSEQLNGVAITSDGSALLTLGYSFPESTVYQYDLSTPYDVETASYSGNSFGVANLSGESFVQGGGLSLSNDDSKLYVTEFANHGVYEFNL
jgi:sugar lactone lactonase YvrE